MLVTWNIEATEEYHDWFTVIDKDSQSDVDAVVTILSEMGPQLPRPYADTLQGSRHSNMKELRIQSHGNPIRVFFAFDPLRSAVLLIGGDKTGDKRFYDRMIPIADDLYDKHLKGLKDRGAM